MAKKKKKPKVEIPYETIVYNVSKYVDEYDSIDDITLNAYLKNEPYDKNLHLPNSWEEKYYGPIIQLTEPEEYRENHVLTIAVVGVGDCGPGDSIEFYPIVIRVTKPELWYLEKKANVMINNWEELWKWCRNKYPNLRTEIDKVLDKAHVEADNFSDFQIEFPDFANSPYMGLNHIYILID